jgi:hypothetical protein
MLAFLCGGMEFAPQGGAEWRERIRRWLEDHVNHSVYDPTLEARRLMSEEDLRELPGWKATDLERYRKAMRFIINHDLDVMRSRTDYVVCNWDQAAARGGGTQAELTAAYRKGIPVYLVSEMPVEEIPGWVVGCTTTILSSFDELKSFLTATYVKEARQRALWGPR